MAKIDPFIISDEQEEKPWKPPAWPTELPAPGIYHDVPDDVYFAWPAMSQSTLRLALIGSCRHIRAALDGTMVHKPTDAMRLGRAIHAALLTPHTFQREWIVDPRCQAILSTGKRRHSPCGAVARHMRADGTSYACGVHMCPGDVPIANLVRNEDVHTIQGLRSSIANHPAVRVLRHRGGSEVAVITSIDGLPFKCKLDRFSPATESAPPIIVDLKKHPVLTGSVRDLQRRMRDYHMDLQAYCYTRAIRDILGQTPAFVWVFLEDGPPYDVQCRQASELTIELGRVKFEYAWGMYLDSVKNDRWPGYSDSLETLDPDDYELMRYAIDRG